MLSNILSMSLLGVEGYLVNVQVDINTGLPAWEIVGLPDATVRESKERVRSAIKNSGYELISRKIVINLAPAYTKKEGSSFDLPIAIGILTNLGYVSPKLIKEYVFIGELSLDGKINKVNGILPMCVEAYNLGIKKVIIPYENRYEASVVQDLEVFPVMSLKDVVNHFNNIKKIESFRANVTNFSSDICDNNLDFSDVKGQENAKRVLEISAAGAHNCLLIGSPGSGKTMLSKRVPTILPDLTFSEALEITKIHSISGILQNNNALIMKRPFRSPHHTASAVAMAGGGVMPKPGEMSLAHYGVLYLDELPEFDKSVLEVMRGPLEDKKITLSRMNCTLTYPCNFMLVASMNPCPCGYANDLRRKCTCSVAQISKYMKKISGPLLDRIDIHIEVMSVEYEKLESDEREEKSSEIRKRVNNARKIQLKRYKDFGIISNSELKDAMLNEFCKLEKDSKVMLKKAFEKLGISARAYGKILKVSRTIADLDECKDIELKHVAEAIQYRTIDRKLWR